MTLVRLLVGMFCLSAIAAATGWCAAPTRYEIWELAPAPNRGGVTKPKRNDYPFDEDWERWSYPLGNGTLGANLFGRADTERVQLSEKTLCNSGGRGKVGGLTNLAELYLDFAHEDVKHYRRSLSLNDAIASVAYEHNGVRYEREYFVSYPDDVLVIHLTSSKPGALTFTVRPEIPYLEARNPRDSKTGETHAEGATITQAGTVAFFNLNYETQVRVVPTGGRLVTSERTVRVEDADQATLIIGAGTNYVLNSQLFLEEPGDKLDPRSFPHERVAAKVDAAAKRGYASLRERHLADYQNLFGRVRLNLNSVVSDLPTHELLEDYKSGRHDVYLEELMFQYARYLLIASSRETSLPAHLQGAWSQYEVAPWSGGYWHNINVQMNYWGAMSANLPETFEGYLGYFAAVYPKAVENAKNYLAKHEVDHAADAADIAKAASDDPGWIIGTGCNPYHIGNPGGHSGPGTGGLTSKLLMEYYLFTQDEQFLRETAYPALMSLSRFFSRALHPAEDGLLLVKPSASPEQRHQGQYYLTVGCTFDQGFVWENHQDTLRAAEALGDHNPFLATISDELPRLDPILIGSSGQIKEFREEDAYSDFGERHHRHISHLCGLYPGTLINSSHPEWMAAASKTLDLRGNNTTGWAMAHRMNCRARLKEAEKAHQVYQKFIAKKTTPNLWTLHPPFQIDGNFGAMAGVAEMLLQSHEGCVEVLPALPAAWGTGYFDGLVARGNFVVSARWRDGATEEVTLLSRSGRPCTLRCPGLKGAAITTDNGAPVRVEWNGDNEASFPTQPGETYHVVL